MPNKKLNISLGALAPSISGQLKARGFKHNVKICAVFNSLDTCAARLYFAGLISERDRKRVINKLFKKIKQHVENYGAPSKPKK